ncbi:MAG: HAD hydrolase-like protein [Acidobacteria bacterium]|nr:HAD hydrolase-like protein [Acidobacteriota bacterium]
MPFALTRARDCGLPEIDPSRILVVGDTPHDVACARAVGATPVAVATGGFTVDQLRNSGADIVYQNLADPTPFLKLLDE